MPISKKPLHYQWFFYYITVKLNAVIFTDENNMKQLNKLTVYSVLILMMQMVMPHIVFAQAVDDEKNYFFKQSGKASTLTANIDDLRTLLLSDVESMVVALPLPNGDVTYFTLTPVKIMADGLAKKYPNTRTFSGTALDNPSDTGRFDITSNGFHGMFYYGGERIFIEPENVFVKEQAVLKSSKEKRIFNHRKNEYKSYAGVDNRLVTQLAHKFHPPKKIESGTAVLQNSQINKANKTSKSIESQSTIKTYRIAIAAAAEYTQFNGGTVNTAMAEIVTLVNRLNEVYQHDLAIKLELVENSDLLIFTNSDTDPFNNDSDDGELNTAVIDGIIGSESYDIGHVVNTDGGGLAVLGGVCDSIYKGDGVTGDPYPINDSFYIDYVAHEIGHQFGANHTFNGSAGACEGNRVSHSAYEVGSGSTIMSYAGICDDQNIQPHSDAFFHARSIEQISDNIQNGRGSECGAVTGELNNTPVVDAGLDYTIPAQTPFKLSGSAQDSDSDSLSYSWQQFDLGNASSSRLEQIDDGTRPLFRAFLPSENVSRYFPQLTDVLNSTSTSGESLPTTNRELNFRLMVFDDEGGVSFDETKLTVIDTGEAFTLNTPLLGDTWTNNNNPISWQVAGTNIAPINCSSVDILLSKDNGENFDVTLVSGVDNNGSTNIDIGSFCRDEINTANARVKLVCSDNIFYSINEGVFVIDKALASSDVAIITQQSFSLVQGGSVVLNTSHFTYACETADSITIQAGDNYTVLDETITPNSDFVGELSVPVIANKGSVASEIFDVTINVEAKPEPEPEPEPTEPTSGESSGGSAFWLLFFISVLPWRYWCREQ